MTDASILNAIATETPVINASTASWGASGTITYGRIATNNYLAFEFSESFIGTITTGTITDLNGTVHNITQLLYNLTNIQTKV